MTSHARLNASFEDFFTRCLGLSQSDEVDRLLELELSMSQTKVIFLLTQAKDAMPITALAERIGLSVATAGRTVDQLVKAELVERDEDPSDRRVKLVTITKAGREIAEQHFQAHQATLDKLFARLSADDADRLADALQPLIAALDQTIEQETPA